MKHIAEGVDKIIGSAGQFITYSKNFEGSSYSVSTGTLTLAVQEFVIKAAVRVYSQREIIGLVKEGDREVRIAAKSIDFVPEEGDGVTVDGGRFRVAAVNVRNAGAAAALYIMRVTTL